MTRLGAFALAAIFTVLGLGACLDFETVYSEYCGVPGRCPDGGTDGGTDGGQKGPAPIQGPSDALAPSAPGETPP